jgi:hypothetical protein
LTRVKIQEEASWNHQGMKMAAKQIVLAAPVSAAAEPGSLAGGRLMREWQTVAAMIRIYCRGRHQGSDLCPECRELLDYAGARLERCRFGAEKPACANCPVHCYQRIRRDQIKDVMRYAGPSMLWRHPVLSARHWLDGFRKATTVID